jgi:hypothetical protein
MSGTKKAIYGNLNPRTAVYPYIGAAAMPIHIYQDVVEPRRMHSGAIIASLAEAPTRPNLVVTVAGPEPPM